MKYIKLRKVKSLIEFRFKRVLLGYSYREVDGLYVFVFTQNQGCWSSYILREIADILDALNKEWNSKLLNLNNNTP